LTTSSAKYCFFIILNEVHLNLFEAELSVIKLFLFFHLLCSRPIPIRGFESGPKENCNRRTMQSVAWHIVMSLLFLAFNTDCSASYLEQHVNSVVRHFVELVVTMVTVSKLYTKMKSREVESNGFLCVVVMLEFTDFGK